MAMARLASVRLTAFLAMLAGALADDYYSCTDDSSTCINDFLGEEEEESALQADGRQLCATNYGQTTPCCGVPSFPPSSPDAKAKYICPASKPSCVGYRPGVALGTCQDIDVWEMSGV
eukprot:TRINITY_DN93178_c0_g1_i1.p3 TRINITY_DN93178_c0_g1~~TRINITY_DN93178_c0_g1_i1.p3  ORF type:complete len:118 (-),score=17.31 TRINITY_DN93178_c0_g1_i1:336-689(-)